jgi:hypothetical protein
VSWGSGNSVEAAPTSENSRDVGVDAVLQAGTKEVPVSAAARGDSAQPVRDERMGSGGAASSSREQRRGEASVR